MALRRGKITRDRCPYCGLDDVIALIPNPAQPLDVRWVCKEDRQAELKRQRSEEARRVAAAAQSNWKRERAATLTAVALLPPAERTQLETIAARGPGGLRLSTDAPLYTMNLIRLYERYRNERAGGVPRCARRPGPWETI